MKKLTLILLCIVHCALCIDIVAQTRHMAEHLFNIENYEDAYKVYVKLMEAYPKDYLLKYQAGRCLFELELYDEALPLFEKAVQKNVVKANRFLGDIYFYQYRFEDAAEAYSAYIASLDVEQDSLINIYKQKIAKTDLGINMLDRVEDVAIIDSV